MKLPASWLGLFLLIGCASSCGETGGGLVEFHSDGKPLETRRDEVARFVTLHSEPAAIEYSGWLQDNSGGFLAGPSDWEVAGYLKVTPGDEALWLRELPPAAPPSSPALDKILEKSAVDPESLTWSGGTHHIYGTTAGLVVFVASTEPRTALPAN